MIFKILTLRASSWFMFESSLWVDGSRGALIFLGTSLSEDLWATPTKFKYISGFLSSIKNEGVRFHNRSHLGRDSHPLFCLTSLSAKMYSHFHIFILHCLPNLGGTQGTDGTCLARKRLKLPKRPKDRNQKIKKCISNLKH